MVDHIHQIKDTRIMAIIDNHHQEHKSTPITCQEKIVAQIINQTPTDTVKNV
jgi:hypothetical protein